MFKESILPKNTSKEMLSVMEPLTLSMKEAGIRYNEKSELVKHIRDNITTLVAKKQDKNGDLYWQEIVKKIQAVFFDQYTDEELLTHVMYRVLNDIETDFDDSQANSVIFDEADMRVDKFLNDLDRVSDMDEIDFLYKQLDSLLKLQEDILQ